MSESLFGGLKLRQWTAVEGAPDWKQMVFMEGKNYRAQFHHERTNRYFKHPPAAEFMEMYKLELDEVKRKIFKDAAVTLMSLCKKMNKRIESEASVISNKSADAINKLGKSKKPLTKTASTQGKGESSSSPDAMEEIAAPINNGLDKQLKALGPEPEKGAVGTNQRWQWTKWHDKKSRLEAEAKDILKAKAAKVNSKKSKAVSAAKTKTLTKANTKPKARPKTKTKANEPAQPESDLGPIGDEVKASEKIDEENEFINFRVATRAPSKNAKGHSRRLGKGKRSSDDGGGDVPTGTDSAGSRKVRRTAASAGITQEMNTMNPVLPGVAQLFQAERTGSKGLRAAGKANSGREAIMPSDMIYLSFLKSVPKFDPLYDVRCRLQDFYLKQRMTWLWQLQLNYSLLFFGIGCKRRLLERFAEEALDGEDVLMIDGSVKEGGRTGNRVVRALLDSICTNKLNMPTLGANCLSLDSYVAIIIKAVTWHYHKRQAAQGRFSLSRVSSLSSGVDDMTSTTAAAASAQEIHVSSSFLGLLSALADERELSPRPQDSRALQGEQAMPIRLASVDEEAGIPDTNWGGRYAHALPKLYIIVNAIDGAALQSVESQRVLAALTECPAISLIASADKLNATLLWSNEMLDQYRWYFVHTPTYESYELSRDFALLHGNKGTMHIQASSVETILNSLTMRHKELFTLLAKESLKEGQDNHNSRGVPFDQLLDKAMKAMLVNTSFGLNNYLKEFADHKVIMKSIDSNKREWVRITLPRTTIEQMLQS